MTTIPQRQTRFNLPADFQAQINRFVTEQITHSWLLTLWLIVLTLFTINTIVGRVQAAPVSTIIVLVVWAATVILVAFNELRHKHNALSLWLKNNMYNTITNIQISLLIVLGLIAAIVAFYNYAWVNASFLSVPAAKYRAELVSANGQEYCFTMGGIDLDISPTTIVEEPTSQCFPVSELTAPVEGVVGEVATSFCFDDSPSDPENGVTCFESLAFNPDFSDHPGFFVVEREFTGANWGAVEANMTTLMIFRFNRNEVWRIWAVIIMLGVLLVPTMIVYRDSFQNKRVRQIVTYLWLATPILIYLFLRGVEPVPFEGSVVSGIWNETFAWTSPLQELTDAGQITVVNGRPFLRGDEGVLSPISTWARLRATFTGNRDLFGVLGLIIFGGLTWFINRRYPQKEREGELVRFGRAVLRILLVITAVLAFLALLQVFAMIIGSITYTRELLVNETPQQVTQPIFSSIDPDVNWGGFLLTLIITIFAIVVSFPIGLVLALGRRSKIRGIPAWLTYGAALVIAILGLINSTPALIEAARNNFELVLAYWPILVLIIAYAFQRTFNGNVLAAFSTLYIEFVRGVPLITVIFSAQILFPILLPPGLEILNTWRVLWAFAFFAAAYLAENVRGGLQAIPNGQYEAADSLGFSAYQKYRLIILPQALRVVIPAIVGQFIGLFKDTTLVAIVGMFDILGVANAIAAQEDWLGVRREPYIFLAVLYFVGSALMTAYSRRLEKQTGLGER
ncbi:MAG: amino acid ABC transporter permease [Ardenticatenaceae bacterium]|nr:amino acid ABC transporter permease [Ardenticatenaceae bacterium]